MNNPHGPSRRIQIEPANPRAPFNPKPAPPVILLGGPPPNPKATPPKGRS